MQLTEQQIKLFQDAYEKDFGKTLLPSQLLDKARRFYCLAEIIAKYLSELPESNKQENNKNNNFLTDELAK
jgi:hypothetical protein